MKITYYLKIGIIFLIFGLNNQLFAQVVNTTSSVNWLFNFGTANQISTYSSGTDSYFKPASATGIRASKVRSGKGLLIHIFGKNASAFIILFF
jgi:hypothetical protein